jgi:molybdenum cofactor guanylyltransferase
LKDKSSDIGGLVMMGGQSTRMGTPKGSICYHNEPQYLYLLKLLNQCCEHAYLSCSAEQAAAIETSKKIVDVHAQAGPMGGLLSAFAQMPQKSWLVVACDMPFVTLATFDFLIANRNPEAIATVFRNPVKNTAEPLLSIWEASAYPVLQKSFEEGQRSLLKILQQEGNVQQLEVPDKQWLINVNTPEDYKKAMLNL